MLALVIATASFHAPSVHSRITPHQLKAVVDRGVSRVKVVFVTILRNVLSQPRRVRALHCRRNRDRHDLGAGGRRRAASARVQPCRGLLRASRCPPLRSDRALSRARRRPLVGRPQHAPQRYPGGQDTRRVEAIRPERDVPHLQLQPRGPFRSTPLEGTS